MGRARIAVAVAAFVVSLAVAVAPAGASSVTNLRASANTAAAGAVDAQYTVTVTTHAFLAGPENGTPDYIQVTAPAGTTFGATGYTAYGITIAGNTTFPSQVQVDPTPPGGGSPLGNNVVDIYMPNDLPAGAAITLTIPSVSNPATADGGGTLSVSTSSDTTTVSTAFAITGPTKDSQLSASANVATAGSVQAVYTVALTMNGALAGAENGFPGYVQVTAPSGTTFTNSGYITLTIGANTVSIYNEVVNPTPPGGGNALGNNVVDIYMPNDVAAGTTMTLTIPGVANPTAAGPSDTLSISTSSDTATPAASTSFPITAATTVSQLSAGANTTTAGSVDAIYTVSLKTTGALAGNENSDPGYVEVTAPAGTTFGAMNPSAYGITIAGNTTFPSQVQVDPTPPGGGSPLGNNVVDIYMPNDVPAGAAITLTIPSVSNPATADGGGTLSVSTSSDTATPPRSTPFPITAATEITGLTAGTPDAIAGATNAVYTVSLTATSPIAGHGVPGYVEVTAPAGTVFSSNGYEVTYGNQQQNPYSVIVNPTPPGGQISLGNNVVDIYMPFDIPAGVRITLTIPGVSNPPSADPTGMLSVSTSSDTKVDSTSFPIAAPTSVSLSSATASTRSAGAVDVTYTLTLKVDSPLAGSPSPLPGYVQVVAPAGTTFPSYSGYYSVTLGSDTETPQNVVVNPSEPSGSGTLGNNVVDVYMPFDVPANSTLTFQIPGVSNPSVADGSAQLAVTTSSDTAPASIAFPVSAATTVSSASSHASSASAGATDVVYTATVTVSQAIEDSSANQTGYVQFDAPAGTVFNTSPGDYEVQLGSTRDPAEDVTVDPNPPGGNVGLGDNVVDVYLPFTVPAGSTVEFTIDGASNPASAGAADAMAVSTSSDAAARATGFRITAATAVTGLVALMTNTNPGATGVDYRTFLTLTQPLAGSPPNPSPGFVELTGPPGSVWNGSTDPSTFMNLYTVTWGLRQEPAAQVVVDPVPPGDQLGLGNNVVDVYMPFDVPAGARIQIDTSVTNAKAANAPRSFTASTSSDTRAAATILGLQPTIGRTVGLTPTGGKVTVKQPGKHAFTQLHRGEIIELGSTVDAGSGVASVKSAVNLAGTSLSGSAYGGTFGVGQESVPAPKHKKRELTVLTLGGVKPNACPRSDIATHRKPKRHRTNRLWASGAGNQVTVGGAGSGTDVGTKWLTEDSCNGTLFKVTQGSVKVDDFFHHRTFVLTAGHQFLTHPGPGG